MDGDTLNELKNAGIPNLLAKHIAHLFIRDPLVIYKERIEIDDANDVDHLKTSNLQIGKVLGGSRHLQVQKIHQILDGELNSVQRKFN